MTRIDHGGTDEADPIALARRGAAGDLAPEVFVWISTGLARHLAGEPLDRALRLDRASRVRHRNRALRDAAALLDDGGSRWALAARLEKAVKRFESRIWPRIRNELAPDLGDIDEALRRAFAADAGMLRCQRAIYELLD